MRIKMKESPQKPPQMMTKPIRHDFNLMTNNFPVQIILLLYGSQLNEIVKIGVDMALMRIFNCGISASMEKFNCVSA